MHGPSFRFLALTLATSLMALFGCSKPPAAVPPPAPAQSLLVQPSADLSMLVNGDDARLRNSVEAARNIISTKEFLDSLAGLGVLYATSDRKMPSATVAAHYLGKAAPAQLVSKYNAARFLLWRSPCTSQTAGTVISQGPNREPLFALTNINGCTFSRSELESGTGAFSCAINTIAHEWAHAIPAIDKEDVWMFQDGSHNDDAMKGHRLVSYTVGALAQCIYLEHLPGYGIVDLDDCICRIGTATFDPSTCSDDAAHALSERDPTGKCLIPN